MKNIDEFLSRRQSASEFVIRLKYFAGWYLKYKKRLAQGAAGPFYMDSLFNQRLALLVAEDGA